MTKEIVKKGYELAQKELEDKQIEKVKIIVKDTLSKIKDLEDEIKELEDEKKILKLDIADLKEGRLDRIEQRQQTDKKAKKTSVVIVEKEVHHHHYDRWNEPYKITYVPYYPPVLPLSPMFIGGFTTTTNATDTCNAVYTSTAQTANLADVFSLNSSITKNNVIGTYDVHGHIVNLR